MKTPAPNQHRRAVVAALASLPLGCSAADSGSAPGPSGQRTLVAYFSRSGNTRVVAGLIHRSVPSDLFEIVPATPYPEEYLATVEQARRERDQGIEPPLQAHIATLDRYDTVYLGFPIWGETAPPVIRSLLSQQPMAGKTLVPFITHGGYGTGSSLRVLATHAPNARIQKPFVMQADQERRTMDSVNAWLGAFPRT
ncbi:flavodoxin [Stenotrophomonas sp. SAU14A_NAIMI4_8]|uniref:flavodoxin n=1 Tax=Stenotrophomonas sp. SAU14A_NAIMI4_8 TaxID=2072409 RepID=UPI000D53F112|nr:flavodoxin [Stenotrophomonas sp. SAU14A_NAIMI4_8]AWH33248.1 flavodoxin [Stenotrophomonas sp. SAU14A_NAIMI4_8]